MRGCFDPGLFTTGAGRFTTPAELLACARAGKLNLGTRSVGGTQHPAAKLFATRAGIAR